MSAVPLAGFLGVALVGVALHPTPVAGWACAVLLLIAITLSIGFGINQRFKGAEAATLGAGSSLAFFAACYIVMRLIDPNSVQQSEAPISSIADAASLPSRSA